MKKIVMCVLTLLGALSLVPACGGDGEDLPPVYMCQGKALACASRTLDQCMLGADCQIGGRCSGTPAYCGGLTGVDCLSQDGCTWDISDTGVQSCSGVPKPCSDQKYEFDCTGMKGCSWTPGCTPLGTTAPSCIGLSQNQCKLISGCAWTRAN
ncbi:MAG: hypothetical protein ACOY0T_37630 [Myxococcota bacterium]